MQVRLTDDARRELDALPVVIHQRVIDILARLSAWPAVSGAKPMRGDLKGHYRIRTGDWRILFIVRGDVLVVRIQHRSTVYED
ncbi:MAG: hypothetical protein RLZZ127_2427 [Planctomycetota bacterium]